MYTIQFIHVYMYIYIKVQISLLFSISLRTYWCEKLHTARC